MEDQPKHDMFDSLKLMVNKGRGDSFHAYAKEEIETLREQLMKYRNAANLAVKSWGDYSPKQNSRAATALRKFKELLGII